MTIRIRSVQTYNDRPSDPLGVIMSAGAVCTWSGMQSLQVRSLPTDLTSDEWAATEWLCSLQRAKLVRLVGRWMSCVRVVSGRARSTGAYHGRRVEQCLARRRRGGSPGR
ncbi:hypothetical protein PVAP13_2NG534303 [Panicum virgatum]|uniref:Uncharacterized protein n=1 Tax=Panicum virgatum TaxID=38727 RepID=A0A8T0W2G4_PANVG|nr:hypothetical protein PVAP13_2NG534303 [Panicum virgatum]